MNGNWNDQSLKKTIRAVDNGAKIFVATHMFGIPMSSLTNHLDGKIKSHRYGKEGTLFVEEDKQLVNNWVLDMQNMGLSISLQQLKHKKGQHHF
jgi:hypothetical protein